MRQESPLFAPTLQRPLAINRGERPLFFVWGTQRAAANLCILTALSATCPQPGSGRALDRRNPRVSRSTTQLSKLHLAPRSRTAPRASTLAAAAFAALTLALGVSMSRPASAAVAPAAHGPIVKMTTTQGVILIKLYPKDAPISCANFLALVKKGFYNGLMFHRVTDLGGTPGQGHIAQGGDPNSRTADPAKVRAEVAAGGQPTNNKGQSLGDGGSPKEIKGEFSSNGVNNPLTHSAGAVAMARSGDPNSASSQFYICTTPAHFLDGNYAVFGMVIQGLPNAAHLQVGSRIVRAVVEK